MVGAADMLAQGSIGGSALAFTVIAVPTVLMITAVALIIRKRNLAALFAILAALVTGFVGFHLLLSPFPN